MVFTRIGHIVFLFIQLTIPDMSNGDMVARFTNIPEPNRNEIYFTSSNGVAARSFVLRSEKTINAAGNVTNGAWLSTTVVYPTNELI